MLKQRASLLSFVFDKETLVRIFRKHSSVLTLSDLKNVFRELFKAVFRTQVAVFGGIFVNIVKNVGSTKTNLTWQVDCSSLSPSLSLSLLSFHCQCSYISRNYWFFREDHWCGPPGSCQPIRKCHVAIFSDSAPHQHLSITSTFVNKTKPRLKLNSTYP